VFATLIGALVCTLAVAAHAGDSKADKQKKIRKMAQDTLQRLYKAEPKAKARVENAAGYAVFSDVGVKILLTGSGKGHGLAVNNKSKHETFMKMLELQPELLSTARPPVAWKGQEKYVAIVPQVFDLWQDPQERYDIFMNNYTERTWTLVTITEAIQTLMKTYIKYPPRPLQSLGHTGPMRISDYEKFKALQLQLEKQGTKISIPN
jgi:hypothetical protein